MSKPELQYINPYNKQIIEMILYINELKHESKNMQFLMYNGHANVYNNNSICVGQVRLLGEQLNYH